MNKPCLSIANIAYSCGFATSQYFSTVFKKYEKCTPIEFRNKEIFEEECVEN
jgi:AraC family L-rhamnose operon regulatory protein RhaS